MLELFLGAGMHDDQLDAGFSVVLHRLTAQRPTELWGKGMLNVCAVREWISSLGTTSRRRKILVVPVSGAV
jgi:hypothetical protein